VGEELIHCIGLGDAEAGCFRITRTRKTAEIAIRGLLNMDDFWSPPPPGSIRMAEAAHSVRCRSGFPGPSDVAKPLQIDDYPLVSGKNLLEPPSRKDRFRRFNPGVTLRFTKPTNPMNPGDER
jgi:hypothetical protein